MKNTYVEMSDGTLVTYNDIHRDADGEHIALYFEKPVSDGFAYLETSLPDLDIVGTEGFSSEQIQDLLSFARDNAALIWDMAREGGEAFAHAV